MPQSEAFDQIYRARYELLLVNSASYITRKQPVTSIRGAALLTPQDASFQAGYYCSSQYSQLEKTVVECFSYLVPSHNMKKIWPQRTLLKRARKNIRPRGWEDVLQKVIFCIRHGHCSYELTTAVAMYKGPAQDWVCQYFFMKKRVEHRALHLLSEHLAVNDY